MARDLYGELLSNALSRRAPPGHFAAYINPNEAAILRSQGGGVAPGGGQYMANGMPAFIEDVGAQAWGGSDLDAAPSGWGLGYGGGGGRSSAAQAVIDEARQAKAAAQQVASMPAPVVSVPGAQTAYGPQEEPGVWGEGRGAARTAWGGTPGRWGIGYEDALANKKANQERLGPAYITNLTLRQADQLAIINSNPDLTSAQRTEKFSKPISEDGTGQYSPATMLSGQGAPADVIAHVMTPSASGGYAINDPESDVSVPAGYHMGFVPAAMASLIGAVSPLSGLMAAGYPSGLWSWAGDSLEDDPGALGTVASGLGGIRTGIADVLSPVTGLFDALGTGAGNLVSQGAQGLGDFLQSNIGSGDPAVADFGPPSHGGFDPPFVDETLPETPTDDESVPDEEEPFVSEVSPEMLARLEANAAAAEERLQRMGMLA
jgi:hypothetical protein